MSTERKLTKIRIPHPKEEGIVFTGTLEQVSSASSLTENGTHTRPLALIVHGGFGHKDYLYQKGLASRLPIDSFRYDLRGNGESTGIMRFGSFATDVADMQIVVDYLCKQFGYDIRLIVSHSIGTVTVMHWLCFSPNASTVRGFVNVSGRYRLEKIYDWLPPSQKSSLETRGYWVFEATAAGRPLICKVTTADMQDFATFDIHCVWDRFPSHIHVLTMHGLRDKVVPPYDALIYGRALGLRTPGTHSLCIVESADHNFTKKSKLVVDTVLDWWDRARRDELTTGIWDTGVRGKL